MFASPFGPETGLCAAAMSGRQREIKLSAVKARQINGVRRWA
jgi:hypothetical protein